LGSISQNAPRLFPVTIRQTAGTPKVNTGLTNYYGQPVLAACSSCHATTKPNIETHSSAELDQFHQGLKYAHGNLACLSCHNAKNYDTLQLATGKPVEFENVMTLCAQCHGTAMRDYERGSHGGMNGYWDLTKGPRTRNNCVNCHDPHSPKYPQAMPVFAPRDRLAIPAKGDH
jgi:cytochrome c553